MTMIGTPYTQNATKVLLLGSGELGKYLTIELQKFGVEVIACDSYDNAPAMQVASDQIVFDMTDKEKLLSIIENEQPTYIVPEVEALSIEALVEAEDMGHNVIPNARAVSITMNRTAIRSLASSLGLKTTKYFFAESLEEIKQNINSVGFPCVIKPVMSSSGKGQTVCKAVHELRDAWEHAQTAGRVTNDKVIVESFIYFDSEVTLLTVRSNGTTRICNPIGHTQENGDYNRSWQPHIMSTHIFNQCRIIAQTITDNLSGNGLFGVELFIKGEDVYFNEVSPRPHDTGLVTLISQDVSQFALHARAILGLPINSINYNGASASAAFLVEGESENVVYNNIEEVLKYPNTELHLFGKPKVNGRRRMGVVLTKGNDIHDVVQKVTRYRNKIDTIL